MAEGKFRFQNLLNPWLTRIQNSANGDTTSLYTFAVVCISVLNVYVAPGHMELDQVHQRI